MFKTNQGSAVYQHIVIPLATANALYSNLLSFRKIETKYDNANSETTKNNDF